MRIVRPEFSVDEEGYVEDADNDFDISNNPANLLKVPPPPLTHHAPGYLAIVRLLVLDRKNRNHQK